MKYFVYILIAIAIVACNNSKEIASEKEVSDKAKADKKMEAIEMQASEGVILTSLDVPDSLLASIERTACYGTCPTYIIKVYKSGYVTYEGIRFVKNEGMFHAKVNEDVLDLLLSKAKDVNYSKFENEFNEGITDIPSTITQVRLDGKVKQVTNRGGDNQQLIEFEKYFDSLFANINWEKSN